jgi:hypothetical protein
MEKITSLLKEYSRAEHLDKYSEKMVDNRIDFANVKKIYSHEWEKDTIKLPYKETTHLLDSYMCLPERPDMAFTFLWKSINAAYNRYYYEKLSKSNKVIRKSDSGNLKLVLKELEGKLDDKFKYEESDIKIRELINMYVNEMPIKTLKFVSNNILKGIVIDDYFTSISKEERGEQYNSSQYSSFKKNYNNLYITIHKTYGENYKKAYKVKLINNNPNLEYKIKDADKARRLTHSLAQKIKELITSKSTEISDSNHLNKFTLELNDDKEYLEFIFVTILYAVRNSSVHGNEASKLYSISMTKDSMRSSNYTFYLGHMFLSLLMYLNGNLAIDELVLNMENLKLL